MAPLLFIHPAGHLNELVIPSGAISAMNSAPGPRLGRYAFEVSDDEIAAAEVIAIDLHWALALNGFGPLVAHIRTVAPTTPIVVGGISASHYAGELLRRHDIDYVVQGDADTVFPALVADLLAGRTPGPLANLHRRQASAPALQRMTSEELSATDCVSTDWFPTATRFAAFEAHAFTPSATIPVARGCSHRCDFCYGSFAATFGEGVPIRSPDDTVRMVRAASESGQPALRLIALKLPPRHLANLCEALAAAGPFHFPAGAGFYLCTPPSDPDLIALESAFADMVFLSAIDPFEIVPGTPSSRQAHARGWRRVAERVAVSSRLVLDLWVTQPEHLAAARRRLPQAPGERVKVSYGGTWNVTRPMDGRSPQDLDLVHRAVAPIWTFYAGHLLSPALHRLLRPWALLDELDEEPESSPRPAGPLGAFHDLALSWWRKHRLAALPGLRVRVIPCSWKSAGTSQGSSWDSGGTSQAGPPQGRTSRSTSNELRTHDAAAVTSLDDLALDPAEEGATLAGGWDHRGVTLRARLGPTRARALVLVPCPLGGEQRLDGRWIAAVGGAGLLTVALPRIEAPRALLVEVAIRVQEAMIGVMDEEGVVVARGRVDMGYLRQGVDSGGFNGPAAVNHHG